MNGIRVKRFSGCLRAFKMAGESEYMVVGQNPIQSTCWIDAHMAAKVQYFNIDLKGDSPRRSPKSVQGGCTS